MGNYLANKLCQIILKKKYNSNESKKIYSIFLFDEYKVVESVWYGGFDQFDNPLIIYCEDSYKDYIKLNKKYYYVCSWHHQAYGVPVAYFFNKDMANKLADFLNRKCK